ncbi:MAG: squalene synthase HpnC [Rhodocyclaceae bacterium]|nr:squalene synthase HpnC [Rhodocyclaceae bacterium]
MPVDHYENFPVASYLLPARLRRPVAAIYHFARSADDIADEGDASPEERQAALEEYRAELRAMAAGKDVRLGVFQCLAPEVKAFNLPLQPFHDLLDAFSQDVVKTRYENFPELLDYCRRSANPVGRLLLSLYGVGGQENLARSDAICTALQLANFWQDVALDQAKGRIYLPREELARYRISEEQIAAGKWNAQWAALMDFQVDRARSMMWRGAPLVHELPGRIGWELRLIVQGGLTILQKLQRTRGNVFGHRPKLKRGDWPMMAFRCLFM